MIPPPPSRSPTAPQPHRQRLTTGPITQTTTLEQERSPAFRLIEEIKQKLQADSSVPPSDRSESLHYATLIEHDLKKPHPNQNLIGAVLEPLSKIFSIARPIASLIKLFNASL